MVSKGVRYMGTRLVRVCMGVRLVRVYIGIWLERRATGTTQKQGAT